MRQYILVIARKKKFFSNLNICKIIFLSQENIFNSSKEHYLIRMFIDLNYYYYYYFLGH